MASSEGKPVQNEIKESEEDASAMDFADEDLEDAADISRALRASERIERRSTVTGPSGGELEEDESVSRSQMAKRKRKQTVQDDAAKKFQADY